MTLFAAEGPNGWFFPSDIKEFWWATAAFLVVLALMLWKLLPVVRSAMAARSDRIRDELAAAEQARHDAEAELAALRAKLADADTESARIVSEAGDHAARIRADLVARAEVEAAEARTKAEIEVAASRDQVTADIHTAVAAQAIEAAEKVVAAELDEATHGQLIDRYIEQVRST
jgi:F-type H+-transporting ATPase subunit b